MPDMKGETLARLSRIKPHCRFMLFRVHPVGHSKAELLKKKQQNNTGQQKCTKVISLQPRWQADISTRPSLPPAQMWSTITMLTEKNPQVWQGPWPHQRFELLSLFGTQSKHCVNDALRGRSNASRSLWERNGKKNIKYIICSSVENGKNISAYTYSHHASL